MPFLGGSGGSVSNVPIALQSSLNQPQTQAQGQLVNTLAGGGTPNIFQSYTGPTSATLSPLQNTSLTALSGAVPGAGTAAGAAGGAQSTALQTLGNVQQGADLGSYYQTNIAQPLTHTFEDTTLPDIVSALGGSIGGPQSTAASTAVTDATDNFMNTLAAAQGQAVQQDIGNRLAAAQATPAVAASPLQTLLSTLSAGAVPTSLQQSNIATGLDVSKQYSGQQQAGLTDLLQFLGTQTQTPANQPVAAPGQTGQAGSILQAVGPILSALAIAGVLSDKKFKEDITEIGSTRGGLPLYTYRYKGEDPKITRIGVMAQDVEKKHPELVLDTPMGKFVDTLSAIRSRGN